MKDSANYAAPLVEDKYADFTLDNTVNLAQSRDMKMKIKRSADGTMLLSGFGPPTVTDPPPGTATIIPQPITIDPLQVQALMTA